MPGNQPGRQPAIAQARGHVRRQSRSARATPICSTPTSTAQREFRERFVPSGIAHEAFLNTFERLASFEPWEHDLTRRLLDGYRAAVALVDTNGDGIISAAEGDIDTPNPNCPQGDNTCIFLCRATFNRFAVTREINDGLLAPRFAPAPHMSMSGAVVNDFAPFGASVGEGPADDR